MNRFKVPLGAFRPLLLSMVLTVACPIWAKSQSCESLLGSRTFVVEPTDVETARYWRKFDEEFVTFVSKSMNANRKIYIRAIQEGHPHIEFLRRLGFNFNPSDATDFAMVPTYKNLLMQYEKMTNELIAQKKIQPENVFIPARMFMHQGRLRPKRYGEHIPEGATPYLRLLPDQTFFEVLGRGYLPLGELNADGTTSTFHTPIEHDLGHLSGIYSFADYQSELAIFMRENYDRIGQGRIHQVFYANEMMQLVRPKNRGRLIEFLNRHSLIGVVNESKGRAVLIEKFLEVLKPLSEEQRRLIFDELYSIRHTLIDVPGGALRDIGQINFSLSLHIGEIQNRTGNRNYAVPFLSNPLGRLELMKRRLERNSNGALDIDHLAQILTALENTSHIDFADIFDRAKNFSAKPDDPIFIYFCVNRLAVPEFQMFCLK